MAIVYPPLITTHRFEFKHLGADIGCDAHLYYVSSRDWKHLGADIGCDAHLDYVSSRDWKHVGADIGWETQMSALVASSWSEKVNRGVGGVIVAGNSKWRSSWRHLGCGRQIVELAAPS
jgi:hypothetical protein